jgi:hypothetical protein
VRIPTVPVGCAQPVATRSPDLCSACLRAYQSAEDLSRYLWDTTLASACITGNPRTSSTNLASKWDRQAGSDLDHTSVDEELDASDVTALVGGQENDHFGNFVQGSRSSEGYFANDTVYVLLDLFVGPA